MSLYIVLSGVLLSSRRSLLADQLIPIEIAGFASWVHKAWTECRVLKKGGSGGGGGGGVCNPTMLPEVSYHELA